jgi:hypothetical protein
VCFFAVKSIDLDSWTAEQVENMIKWGNEKANKYWEARLPESSIPNEKYSQLEISCSYSPFVSFATDANHQPALTSTDYYLYTPMLMMTDN